MALTTVDITVDPSDGWKAIAAGSTNIRIKSHQSSLPWYVFVGAAQPNNDATIVGWPMGRGSGQPGDNNEFDTGTLTTESVWVRAPKRVDSSSPMIFTIIHA